MSVTVTGCPKTLPDELPLRTLRELRECFDAFAVDAVEAVDDGHFIRRACIFRPSLLHLSEWVPGRQVRRC